jgi:ligand-binding sensor domain-containing protein
VQWPKVSHFAQLAFELMTGQIWTSNSIKIHRIANGVTGGKVLTCQQGNRDNSFRTKAVVTDGREAC